MIDRRRSSYEEALGFVPGFRIVLHGGEVVAGECGSDRRRIVYYGDAINTAVRLQEIGKALGRDVLVSAALLDHIALPRRCRAVDLGTHAVRGRSAVSRVLALGRVRSRSTNAEASRQRTTRGTMPTIGVMS